MRTKSPSNLEIWELKLMRIKGRRCATVALARKFVDDPTEAKNKYFIYWGIPGMGHGTRANYASGFTAEHDKLVNDAVLLWLLTGETDAHALETLKVQLIKFEDD